MRIVKSINAHPGFSINNDVLHSYFVFREHHLSNAAKKVNFKILPLWPKPCVIEAFTSPVTVRLVEIKTGRFLRSAHITQLKRFFIPNID